MIDEGPRAYIERINIRGNTRTRDYVIRREFDVAEGDAYNRALIDRAERRLKNLNLLQDRQDHRRAGLGAGPRHHQCRCRGAVDRRVLVLRRLFDLGRLARRGQRRRAQPARSRPVRQRSPSSTASMRAALNVSFVEPYLLGYRHRARARSLLQAAELRRATCPTRRKTVGVGTRLGFALARRPRRCSCAIRSTGRRSTLPPNLMNCNNINPDFVNTFPTAGSVGTTPALTAAGRVYRHRELLLGRRSVAGGAAGSWRRGRSSPRWSATRSPTTRSTTTGARPAGTLTEFKQDFAGVGGDVKFVRTSADVWAYHEVMSDVVGVPALQGGQIAGWDGRLAHARPLPDGSEPGARLCAGRHWSARPDAVPVHRRLGDALGGTLLLGRQPRIPDAAVLPAQGHGRQARGIRRRRLAVELYGSDRRSRRQARSSRDRCVPLRRTRSTTPCTFARRSASA